MKSQSLGRAYKAGEVIVRQGEPGNCMYVVQSGTLEVVCEINGKPLVLGFLASGDIFGEMAVFEREPRAATVRAVEDARVLTLDKRTFLGRVQEDPSLAFKLLETMSRRIRELNARLADVEK